MVELESRYIYIFTFGLNNVWKTLCDPSDELRQLQGYTVNPDNLPSELLFEAMSGLISFPTYSPEIVVQPCFAVNEYWGNIQSDVDWDHCGMHWRNVQRLISHTRWPAVADSLERSIEQALEADRSGKPLLILLFCKSGRDRSVGISVALALVVM